MSDDEIGSNQRSWRYYLQRPVLVIFFFGFSGGLPFPLVYSTLTAWLEDADITRSTISTFAWLGFAYSFKFLWSPLVDSLSLPVLTRWLGRRRAWLFVSQLALGASIYFLANIDPSSEIAAFVAVAIAVAFLSATQDIVIDAYRIESVGQELQPVLAASYQYGYRIGVLVATAGAFVMADYGSWSTTYQVMAAFMLVGLVTTLVCHEPRVASTRDIGASGALGSGVVGWIKFAVIEPLADFFTRYGAWGFVLLAFISSFHVSDRVLGILANPFYLDVGYTKTEIGSVAKLYGFWVSMLGVAAGAAASVKLGLSRCLVLAPIFVVSTNLFFAAIVLTGPNLSMLALTISVDNFALGFGSTIMIAFMSSLINVSFTATQYALLSSISTFFGKFFAGYSGDVQEVVGWFSFFLYAAATGIPAIVLAAIVAWKHKTEPA